MKAISLTIIIILFSHLLFAQNCEVSDERIEGTYSGDCLKGKAEGQGKSIGKDSYEGNFKNGYPDGSGIYTWASKEYFKGFFKKSIKEGKGEMHYISRLGMDSMQSGYWKKDKYIGLYEKAYHVQSSTTKVNRVECRVARKDGNSLNITLHQMTSTGNSLSQSTLSPPTISSISVLDGLFITKSSQTLGNSSVTRLQQVNFPFRAIFYFSNGENTEIILNEKADWDINIDTM